MNNVFWNVKPCSLVNVCRLLESNFVSNFEIEKQIKYVSSYLFNDAVNN
jgi:hypothetical protein